MRTALQPRSFFDELGIQPLQAVRHGIALIGVALVPVDAPQHHPLAVQVQATGTNWTVRKPNRTVFSSSTRSGRPLVPGRMSFTVRVYRVGCSMLHGCTPFRVPVMGRASSPR